MYGQLMWMVNTSFYHFNHQQYFHKSCVTVSCNKIIDYSHHILYQQSLPLVRMDICALPLRSAAPLSGGPLPPTSDRGRDPVLCSVYILIWLSLVSVYNKQRSISWLSRSRSAAQLTEWCSATAGHTRHECFHPLVLLAAMLTLLLAHIPPYPGAVLFIFWVRIVLGNLASWQ